MLWEWEVLVCVDSRGRIVIPREFREKLGIGRLVELRIEDGKLVIIPVTDPIDELRSLVVECKVIASKEARRLGLLAEKQLEKEVGVE